MPAYFPDDATPPPRTVQVGAPEAALKAAIRPGARVTLTIPGRLKSGATTNAVGYLPGSDPAAGVILLSAHLDHLGVGLDGKVFAGANDDASGVTALLEFARLLAAGEPPRRGVLFVAYGSEETNGFGARWFGDHPPVPLERIEANLEFEMLGAPVPKLASDRLQMTGFERSNLGAALKDHGALIDADPYPDQNYFRRSDNYALALRGVVAHTLSGYGEPTTYHSPTDTIENLDMDFMVKAIGSLIAPIRWQVDGKFEPSWYPGGKPTP